MHISSHEGTFKNINVCHLQVRTHFVSKSNHPLNGEIYNNCHATIHDRNSKEIMS